MKRLLLVLPLLLIASPADAFWGKPEPWATPKGDARVDCAVYETKMELWSSANKRDDRETGKALAEYEIIKLEDGKEAADRWFESDENPMNIARAKKESLDKEVDLAQINVAKHLGYSKQRLKEMWEWRLGDGPKWIASIRSKKLSFEERLEKGLPRREIISFCEKL